MPRRYLGSFVTYNPVEPTASAASGMWPLNQQLQEVAAGTWPLPFGDPYFNYTTLLLSSTSLSNANNNLFVDSSGAFNPVSRTGNTTQGSFAPYGSYWSNYSDNSGDYLTAGSGSSAFAFGTGNFTIEGWFYSNASVANWKPMLSVGAAAQGQLIRINQGLQFTGNWGMLYPNDAGNADVYFDTGSPFPLNQWVHVALVRNGTTLTLYQNGVNVLQKTVGFNFTNTTGVGIGYGQYPADGVFGGYMSNIRIVKGTAVYTANFTPPTTPLTAISGTSLLTCQSNRFRDASSNNFTVTPAGDIRVTDFSPFLHTAPIQYNQSDITNWSGYFDGSGDYLSLADNTALQMGSGDFTTEFWWYPVSLSGFQTPFEKGYSGSGGLLLQTGNGDGRIVVYASGSAVITASTAPTVGAWNHMALVRSGTSLVLYLNGVSVGSATNSTNFNNTGSAGIGANVSGGGAGAYPVNGYMSNLRIVKGTAVYTGTFTPPTTNLTAISGTSLLTLQNAAFTDNSTNNFVITPNGNVTVTGNSPFNTVGYWSNYFDGSGDYLSLASNDAFRVDQGDWTIEAWVFLNTTSTSHTFINRGIYLNSYSFYFGTSGTSLYYEAGTGGWAATPYTSSAGAVSANQWIHVAAVRSGTSLFLYANGTRVLNQASASFGANTATPVWIGTYLGGTANLNGNMSNFRFVKGTALYTGATYTVPTEPLTAITNTSLLTCQNGRFIDNSTNNFTITPNGNVAVQSFDPFYSSTIGSSGGSMYFDGSADYIEPSWSSTSLPGSWTFECWFYATAASGMIFDCRPNSTNGYYPNVSIASSTQIDFYYNANSNFITVPGGTINKWIHLAVVKNGTSLVVYLDGVSSFSATDSNTWAIGASRPRIGANGGYYSAAPAPLTGYISNFRILNGTAAYTGAFTPPTAPTSPTPNTILMLNGMNAGAFDATATNDFETVGNAQVSYPTPFAPANYWAAAFGSSDYAQISGPATGTGTWTVEGWFYFTSLPGGTVFAQGTADTTSCWFLYLTSSGGLNFYSNGDISASAAGVVTANSWVHIALVSNASNATTYVNGRSVATGSYAGKVFTGGPFQLNRGYGGATTGNPCRQSNVRMVVGTAVYTANFTPPTSPLTAISGTSLLTCQNKTFIDNSANAYTVTPFGSATAGAIGPFTATGGSSVYFDGTGDYLYRTPDPLFAMGTGDFTIEGWLYLNSTGTEFICHTGNAANSLFVTMSSGLLRLTNDATVFATSASTLSTGQWYHFAVVRSSGSSKVYINGSGGTAVACTVNFTQNGFGVGANFVTGANYLNGYIDDLRVTKGYARYTSNFTPPTAALPTY